MNNTIIFIVLGVLVVVVIGFLVFSSVKDRKKRKIVKTERLEEEKEIVLSKSEVAIALLKISDNNAKALKNFVPSVGKVKMSDVRGFAKKSLNLLEKRKEFKFLKLSDDSKEIVDIFLKYKKINSNNWPKQLKSETAKIQKIVSNIDMNKFKEYDKNISAVIDEVYNHDDK